MSFALASATVVALGAVLFEHSAPVTASLTRGLHPVAPQAPSSIVDAPLPEDVPADTIARPGGALPAGEASKQTSPPGNEPDPHDPLTLQIQRITTDYKELAQPIFDRSTPLLGPEDRAALTLLEQEKLTDIAQTLSAEELELYQLHMSASGTPQRR